MFPICSRLNKGNGWAVDREFRLSPAGSGRGISCDANGAFIGTIPLLQRTDVNGRHCWEPRDRERLSEQIGSQFGVPVDLTLKMNGLSTISRALNKGDIARAQIATVLLGIPDPPEVSKGECSRDETIKLIRNLYLSDLIKVWKPDKHPRWPAGASDSQGGQFAPKGESLAQAEAETDEVGPIVNGQTEAESRAASEVDNAAGQALSNEQAAEAAGQETRQSFSP
jgi:hypothetical protein